MTQEGKTKIIRPTDDPHVILMETKDGLTAGDAAKKAQIDGIGIEKTAQTAAIFAYLEEEGIQTAFRSQKDERTLECDACDMIPLEIVIRRHPWGSFFYRHPNTVKPENGAPQAFFEPVVEFFHKHAVLKKDDNSPYEQMAEDQARDLYMPDGGWTIEVHTDPLCVMHENEWSILPAKRPLGGAALMSIDPVLTTKEIDDLEHDIVLPTFFAIEQLWRSIKIDGKPVTLADMKIEVGRRKSDGKIILADVIDNDSWRVWPGGDPANQMDKQIFRDGGSLDSVYENYKKVTALLQGAMKKEG